MCLACEQQALWFAYLQRRGLITPDGRIVEQSPFFADAAEPVAAGEDEKVEGANEAANKGKFACDDPTAG
jgi:hypothetical protein